MRKNNVSRVQVREHRAAFNYMLTKNPSKQQQPQPTLPASVFEQVIRLLGEKPNKHELATMLTVLRNNSSELELLEFIKIMTNLQLDKEDETMEAFKFFDLGKNGQITCDNLLQAFKPFGMSLTQQQAEQMLTECAQGKDYLNLSDFKKLMDMPMQIAEDEMDDQMEDELLNKITQELGEENDEKEYYSSSDDEKR